jgi:hypothetical protein
MIIETEESKNRRIFGSACAHLRTKEVPAAPPHHMRLICLDCRSHLRYISSPATLEQRKRNARMIEQLLAIREKLEAWEASFLRAASKSRNGSLVTRQRLVLEEIHRKYFPEAPPEAQLEEARQ